MTFEDDVIRRTVDKLIKGDDYRDEVVNSIRAVITALSSFSPQNHYGCLVAVMTLFCVADTT